MADKPNAPFFAAPRWEALVIIFCGIVVDLIFDAVGQPGRGTIAVASTVSIVGAIRLSWPLIREYWFWFLIFFLAGLHAFAIAYFSWSNAANWNGLTFIPFTVVDLLLVMTIIYLTYRAVHGRPDQLFADPFE